MNIQSLLPETLNMQQACMVLGMSRLDIRNEIVAGRLTETIGEISTGSVGDYLMEMKGWDQEYTELFIHQSIQP